MAKKKERVLSVYLTQDIVNKLKSISESQERSMSQFASLAIKEKLKAESHA